MCVDLAMIKRDRDYLVQNDTWRIQVILKLGQGEASMSEMKKWEAVYRTTNTGDGADAVVVIPIIKQSQKKDSLILVKQYRPPLKAYSIEFPAGLIDKGESPLECAVREMKEETGYTGIPKDCSPGISLDPGLSSSTVNMVTLEINGDVPENSNPQQHQGLCIDF
ncbi:ADP-sugar pyrophosphatase-like [Littorina saxatilis]|uniref:ADP-sugar pyrophosphatase-like n=1 Tax=Littorina saxatilis TaxID=31220 RepID=UPI0038B48317